MFKETGAVVNNAPGNETLTEMVTLVPLLSVTNTDAAPPLIAVIDSVESLIEALTKLTTSDATA
jgi:hypothetical protein